ncbi:hypothetical protein BD413DRAFT_196048 [Trametes elegans]|nr:hypothetical protein BD413DRAFT_196048 [Trametes elegans]
MGIPIVMKQATSPAELFPGRTSVIPKPSRRLVSLVQTQLQNLFNSTKGPPARKATISDEHLAEKIVDLINKHHLCGDYVAALSRHGTGSGSDRPYKKTKVDAIVYSEGHKPTDGLPDWRHTRMFIGFQSGGNRFDPFDLTDKSCDELYNRIREGVYHQLSVYAYNAMLHKHRTAIYGLLLNGPEFRAMRYSRGGLIVSEKTNYVTDPAALFETLARFSQLSAEAQGLDPTATLLEPHSAAFKLMDEYAEDPGNDMDYAEGTVVPLYTPLSDIASPSSMPAMVPSTSATPTRYANDPPARTRMTRQRARELAALEDAAARAIPGHDSDLDPEIRDDVEDPPVFKYVRTRFRESLQDGWPRYKLEVGPEKRKFLVGKPTFCSVTLFGRGTHGYVALDPKSRRFVFLKDSWRPFYEDVEPEGQYLQILGSGAAKDYVPQLLCHGYVGDTERDPADIVEENDDMDVLREYRHYRLVVKDVGLSFDCIENSQQLVKCLFHCIVGHGFAYKNHHMSHRDVSSGNVLIVPRLESAQNKGAGKKIVHWRGILMDWELAKLVPENKPDEQAPQPEGKGVSKEENSKSEKARQPERTGTWQFMSVHYVDHQATLPVTVADELESFFHVLLFFAIRFMRHSIKDSDVPAFVNQYFDSYYPAGTKRLCTLLKRMIITSGTLESGGQPILFYVQDGVLHGRFNALISRLLKYFKARYEVLQWRTPVQGIQESPPAPQEADAATPDEEDLQEIAEFIDPFKQQVVENPSEPQEAVVKEAPSREVIDLAKKTGYARCHSQRILVGASPR